MQMDPSSSPATADTPAEFTLFAVTKKGNVFSFIEFISIIFFSIYLQDLDDQIPSSDTLETDLSPQYVPAEKFEEERRALYASLLKPDSPKVAVEEVTSEVKECEEEEEEEESEPIAQELPETEQQVIEEEVFEEPKEDDISADKSIEDAMAELHGGLEEPAATLQGKVEDVRLVRKT